MLKSSNQKFIDRFANYETKTEGYSFLPLPDSEKTRRGGKPQSCRLAILGPIPWPRAHAISKRHRETRAGVPTYRHYHNGRVERHHDMKVTMYVPVDCQLAATLDKVGGCLPLLHPTKQNFAKIVFCGVYVHCFFVERSCYSTFCTAFSSLH